MTSERSKDDSRPRNWFDRLTQLLGSEPQNREQLLELLDDARQRALIDTDALNMIEGVLQVSELRVRDIMIPRAEMVFVRREDTLERVLEVAIRSGHSRFPVIGDDKGEVMGVMLAKDLLNYCMEGARHSFSIHNLLRPTVFVPESKRLNVLLKEFRSSRNHLAIVVDEYGSAAGLVTIEDVLEQIVGEIEDEHDYDEGTAIFRRGRNDYSVQARTHIKDFNTYFGTDLANTEFDTIGGLVVSALGHLPKRGESVVIEPFRCTVLRADSRRVYLLHLERLDAGVEAEESQA